VLKLEKMYCLMIIGDSRRILELIYLLKIILSKSVTTEC